MTEEPVGEISRSRIRPSEYSSRSSGSQARRIQSAVDRLYSYCVRERWSGPDPYDGLNSPLARWFPFNTGIGRTVLTQLVKRSPFDPRPFLGIERGLNPKGLALAVRALVLLRESEVISDVGAIDAEIDWLTGALLSTRSPQFTECCWGYDFDWQSRAFFAPRGTPNVVCTVFGAHAMLDLHERMGYVRGIELGGECCRFVLDRLNQTLDGDSFCFSYTPLDRSRVHNVNLLAAGLLARVSKLTSNDEFAEAASRAARFTIRRQMADGGWVYGESPRQQWRDGFHTGYLIVSLLHLIDDLGIEEWMPRLVSAFDHYRDRFFLADQTPKYYDNRLYPIDVHSAAQAVVTFAEMSTLHPESLPRAAAAATWAVEHLQDPAGYFYFQRLRFHTKKVPYMRWAQAWMLYAFSLLISRDPVSEHV